MRISKAGKSVTLPREELESVVRHIAQFGKVVQEFERQEKNGKLPKEWQGAWAHLKEFLLSEELEGSADEKAAGQSDGRYCCRLISYSANPPQTMLCRDYNAWYIFAWAACVGEAILGGYSSQLTSGRCRKRPGCPQYRG